MESAAFEHTVQPLTEHNGVLVALKGSIDAHNAPQLEQVMRELIEQGNRNIILDLSQLQYISSAGLGVFMVLYEEVQEQGGNVLFAALPEKVLTVFDLLGFTQLFQFFPTVTEAQRYLTSEQSEAAND